MPALLTTQQTMAFLLPTSMQQQPNHLAPKLPQLALNSSYYQSTPNADPHQPQTPISAGHSTSTTSWASQPNPLSHHDQMLTRRLENALRKIREHEETILYLATTLNHQSKRQFRIQNGSILCLDCHEEVPHVCYPHSLSTPSSLQPPLGGYERQPASNTFPSPADLETNFRAQENSFGIRHVTPPCSDSTHVQPLPEPERTKGQPNLPEETGNTSRQSEFNHSPRLTAPSLRRLSFNNSPELPGITWSASEITLAVPDDPTWFSEDGVASSEEDEEKSGADWSIAYNTGALDVCLVRSLDLGPKFFIDCLKFSKDGKYLAVGSLDNGTTKIYDAQTGEKTCTLRDATADPEKNIHVSILCFSPDGLYLATAGNSLVWIWAISEKRYRVRNVFRPLRPPSLHSFFSCHIDCIDFSPDSRLIACIIDGCSLQIWNRRDGFRRMFCYLEYFNDIRFSPDGQHIAGGLNSGDVMIWNVRTGALVTKLMGHLQWVNSIAFTPDGTGLVSGSLDDTVRFWDVSFLGMDGHRMAHKSNGRELLNFRHKHQVRFVAVSSNGRWVVSSTHEAVRIWNVYGGELHCELVPNGERSAPVVNFSPIGGCLASAHHRENRVVLWKFREI